MHKMMHTAAGTDDNIVEMGSHDLDDSIALGTALVRK